MDDIQIFNCEQGTPEWFQARCGVPTASCFSDVMAKGQGKTRTKYLYTLAAEILSGEPSPSWGGNEHTERGKMMEQQVRSLYEATSELPVTQVGFIRRGRIGCSPDSLVGDDGLLEIKTKLPHLQIALLEENKLPPEHVAQVQGQLLVTGRQFCDFISYWPGLPEFRVRVYRDLSYLSNLNSELIQFNKDVDSLVARIKSIR